MTIHRAMWADRARTISWLLALSVAASIGALITANPAHAATFTVNRTADTQDANLANAACDAHAAQTGSQCTLRAAIQEANDTSGADVINFNIPDNPNIPRLEVKIISPTRALPPITKQVTINGFTQAGASANTLAIFNNAILKIQLDGTNAGTFADGLLIRASNSTIKGLVINRFFDNGVQIDASGSTGNKVEGNFIGTSATGNAARANGNDGVDISNAPNTTVGGTEAAQRNVISGNLADGVEISGSEARGNKIEGNFIGTKRVGTRDLGNFGDGVQVNSAPDNTIGGAVSGARNVISSNRNGILIQGSGATGNEVEGNHIGTEADGSSGLGNDGDGVLISAGASHNTIGGTASTSANTIRGNGGDGVSIVEGTGNSVLSNFIWSNTGLGIDLFPDGVTGNDGDNQSTIQVDPDSDTGANNLQNFPVITSATQSSTTPFLTTITGTLNSNPNQTYTIQCFLAVPDPSGHGEGLEPVAQTTADTDANGDDSFSCVSSIPQAGHAVTVTATNMATGDTSEFSQNVVVVRGP